MGGARVIHFAGCGSGLNFTNNGNGNVPSTYTEWAKKRYALYLKLLYNKDINIEYDKESYEKLKLYF